MGGERSASICTLDSSKLNEFDPELIYTTSLIYWQITSIGQRKKETACTSSSSTLAV